MFESERQLKEKKQSGMNNNNINFTKYDHQVDSPLRSMKTREIQHRTDHKVGESESQTNDELTLKKVRVLHPDQI